MSNTSIQSTHVSPGVTGPAPVAVSDIPQGLEMDTVMSIIATKYGNLTESFNNAMEVERGRQAKMTLVNNAKQEIAEFTGHDADPNVDTPGQQKVRDAAGKAEQDLIDAGYPATDPTVQKLHDIASSSDNIQSTDLADAASGLDTKASDLGSDSQLNMLQLQDTMSKVQTLMSMATNIEATIHDMQKGIVANMHV